MIAGRGDRPIRSQRTERLAHDVPAVWSALAQPDRYPTWWPWLLELDARALAPGEVWQARIRTPLRYRLRFSIELVEVDRHRSIRADIDGDIVGTATIETATGPAGTELGLLAELRAAAPALRLLRACTPRIARFGHDRVIDRALEQFATRALGPGEAFTGRPGG